jgi:hypothetical protein
MPRSSRHFDNDPDFLHEALKAMGSTHDRLLDLTEEIVGEDPFAALRLLQTCGINMFGHVLSAVPPTLAIAFARERDEAIAAIFATIQQSPPGDGSTHTLLVGAGGAGLTSLEAHAWGGYLGAFYMIDGPLQQRLVAMGGSSNRMNAAALHNPNATKDTLQWAHNVGEAHSAETQLQQSFTSSERHTSVCLAQRGNTVLSAGDPTPIVEDLPITLEEEPLSELHQATTTPKCIRFIATNLRKLTEWRHFFDLHQRTPARDQPKLLTHAGHGSVTVLQSNIPLEQRASAEIVRTTIRRITGVVSLGRHGLTALQHCPQCGVQAGQAESLERHVVKCPNRGDAKFLSRGTRRDIKTILREAGVPNASAVVETRDLRAADRSRPGDVVAMDFFAEGKHLVIDDVLTTVYMSTILEKVATVPGYAAK